MATSRNKGAPRAPKLSAEQIAQEEQRRKEKRAAAAKARRQAKKPNEAHEANIDAAQRELDRRNAEGEDVSAYFVDPKTGVIRKIAQEAEAPNLNDAEQEAEAKLAAAAKAEADRQAYLEALQVDAQALIDSGEWTGTVEEYVATQATEVQDKPRYDGPMKALVSARLSYVKAANGILCNGDDLALLLGDLTREQVCTTLMKAMKLELNPYSHLNPGQQSMNLRNKARGMLKNGTLRYADIVVAKPAKA